MSAGTEPPNRRTRLSVDRVVGVVLMALGAATASEATTFDVGFMTDPVGPKALPMLVGAILVAAGLVALARPHAVVGLPGRRTTLRMAAATAAFLLYAATLPALGFFTATTLVVTALSLLYRGPVLPSVAAAAALSAGLWLLFVELLSLPLPVGDLWIR